MNTQIFLDLLEEYLETEDTKLSANTVLNDLEEYDSLGVLSIISLIDEEFGKKITANDLEKISTVGDLMAFIGNEQFEQ